MKKLTIVLLIVLSLFTLSSCASMKEPYQAAGVKSVLVEKDYEVLGQITVNSTVKNVLGLFTWGGKGYEEVLEAAKEAYPETDEIINIYVDKKASSYFLVYNTWGYNITCTAIKYVD